jgi:hypothetical protein
MMNQIKNKLIESSLLILFELGEYKLKRFYQNFTVKEELNLCTTFFL